MFQYYDYLGWGVGIVPKGDDFLKEASHVETEELYGLDLIQESIDVDFGEDEQEARDDYNLLFLSPHISEGPWGNEDENRQNKSQQLIRQIRELVSQIKPGHELWDRYGGQFLDMFLLEENLENVYGTQYDSVLLVAPDAEKPYPIAIIWELIPEEKRTLLMNLQRAGAKIFASFNDAFTDTENGFLCLEIYLHKD